MPSLTTYMTIAQTSASFSDGADGKMIRRLLDARELVFHEIAPLTPASMSARTIPGGPRERV